MQNAPKDLFNLLISKDFEVKTLDAKGKEISDIDNADMFSFNFEVNGQDYGTVVILLNSESELEVFYGDSVGQAMETGDKKEWMNFLYQLRMFAKRNLMGFKLQDIGKLKYSMQGMAAIKEGLFEGYYGSKKTSYTPQGNARIIIKHTRPIGEGEKRYYNIDSLYVENADGERFKLPFKSLVGARAMARHVTEGGNPYDIFGAHITEMIKDINTLSGFVRRAGVMEADDETAKVIEAGKHHYVSLRKKLKNITGRRGYHSYLENWSPADISNEDVDIDHIRNLFTEKTINSKIDEALPLLARLAATAAISSMDDDLDEAIRNATVVDMDAIHEQGFYEIRKSGFVCEDKDRAYVEFEEFISAIPAQDPRVGNSYIYVSVYGYPMQGIMNIAYFNNECELVSIHRNQQFYFDCGGKIKAYPQYSDLGTEFVKKSFLLDSFNDMKQLLTFANLKLSTFKITTKVLGTSEMKEINEFESWADDVAEGSWALPNTDEKIEQLRDFMSKEQPYGIDAMDVTDKLYDIIGDDDLFDILAADAKEYPDGDSRPSVMNWIRKHMPELVAKISPRSTQESCENELDADNDEHLYASANKILDKRLSEDMGETYGLEQLSAELRNAIADDLVSVYDLLAGTIGFQPSGKEMNILQGAFNEIQIDTGMHADDDYDEICNRITETIQGLESSENESVENISMTESDLHNLIQKTNLLLSR